MQSLTAGLNAPTQTSLLALQLKIEDARHVAGWMYKCWMVWVRSAITYSSLRPPDGVGAEAE